MAVRYEFRPVEVQFTTVWPAHRKTYAIQFHFSLQTFNWRPYAQNFNLQIPIYGRTTQKSDYKLYSGAMTSIERFRGRIIAHFKGFSISSNGYFTKFHFVS